MPKLGASSLPAWTGRAGNVTGSRPAEISLLFEPVAVFQCLGLTRCTPWRFREEKLYCLTHGVCFREPADLVIEIGMSSCLAHTGLILCCHAVER